MNRVEYLAKIEKVLEIPSDERLTSWYSDYDLYEPKPEVTEADIENSIVELSSQIEHSGTVIVEVNATFSRKIPVENAQTIQEAIDTIKEQYNKRDIVLDEEDLVEVQFHPEKSLDMERRQYMRNRLFVDLDGTCAVWQPVAEEQLFEKGYYRNLPEYKNVVAAVNHIVENHPEIEVFVLSKYFTDSKYALNEKDEWVSEHLPGIDKAHRIFVPYEMDKRDMIPDQLKETDYLLDDYTKNFDNWQPPARGIKLLNGINHTKGTWQDNRITLMREPKDFADCIVNIIEKGEKVQDKSPQEVQQVYENEYSKVVDEMLENMDSPELDIEM